eukprot:1801-Heterococcus_DN1.PRE.4
MKSVAGRLPLQVAATSTREHSRPMQPCSTMKCMQSTLPPAAACSHRCNHPIPEYAPALREL